MILIVEISNEVKEVSTLMARDYKGASNQGGTLILEIKDEEIHRSESGGAAD